MVDFQQRNRSTSLQVHKCSLDWFHQCNQDCSSFQKLSFLPFFTGDGSVGSFYWRNEAPFLFATFLSFSHFRAFFIFGAFFLIRFILQHQARAFFCSVASSSLRFGLAQTLSNETFELVLAFIRIKKDGGKQFYWMPVFLLLPLFKKPSSLTLMSH